MFRQIMITLLAALTLGSSLTAASAATLVKVDLWDKGVEMAAPTGLAYGAAGLDMSKATMGMTLSTPTAKAGIVSFHVTNTSKDTVHEMIVIYMEDPTKPLPFLSAENRVDEDNAGDKGEVSELDPGAVGTLTVALKPGKYLLICNVPGHFGAGMWTEFEVTK